MENIYSLLSQFVRLQNSWGLIAAQFPKYAEEKIKHMVVSYLNILKTKLIFSNFNDYPEIASED